MHPLPADMNATIIRTLMKSPDDFQPAFVNAMVKGEEATFEVALRRRGESEGQMSPWKKIRPM